MYKKDSQILIKLDNILNKYFNPEFRIGSSGTVIIERKDLDSLLKVGFKMDEILQAIVEQGYVLHGSPCNVDLLEPKTATGLGAAYERLTAVYFTNLAPIALFNAIMPKRSYRVKSQTSWEIQGTDLKHIDFIRFKASENILEELGDGYIYVVSEKDVRLTPCVCQFISELSCLPFAKLKVRRNDFVYNIEKYS